MKTLLLLIIFLSVKVACASEIMTPEFCIIHHATLLRNAHKFIEPYEPDGIDYKSIAANDAMWTEKKVLELLKSIDPEKVKFEKYDHLAKEIWMIEPFKAKFTFDPRKNENNLGFLPSTIYWLVGIKINPE